MFVPVSRTLYGTSIAGKRPRSPAQTPMSLACVTYVALPDWLPKPGTSPGTTARTELIVDINAPPFITNSGLRPLLVRVRASARTLRPLRQTRGRPRH